MTLFAHQSTLVYYYVPIGSTASWTDSPNAVAAISQRVSTLRYAALEPGTASLTKTSPGDQDAVRLININI